MIYVVVVTPKNGLTYTTDFGFKSKADAEAYCEKGAIRSPETKFEIQEIANAFPY